MSNFNIIIHGSNNIIRNIKNMHMVDKKTMESNTCQPKQKPDFGQLKNQVEIIKKYVKENRHKLDFKQIRNKSVIKIINALKNDKNINFEKQETKKNIRALLSKWNTIKNKIAIDDNNKLKSNKNASEFMDIEKSDESEGDNDNHKHAINNMNNNNNYLSDCDNLNNIGITELKDNSSNSFDSTVCEYMYGAENSKYCNCKLFVQYNVDDSVTCYDTVAVEIWKENKKKRALFSSYNLEILKTNHFKVCGINSNKIKLSITDDNSISSLVIEFNVKQKAQHFVASVKT